LAFSTIRHLYTFVFLSSDTSLYYSYHVVRFPYRTAGQTINIKIVSQIVAYFDSSLLFLIWVVLWYNWFGLVF